jgi:hypothetical protein
MPLCSYVKALLGQGGYNIHLPDFFLFAPETFRYGLLAGILDADDSEVYVRTYAKKRSACNVTHTTRSLRLAREIVLLCKTVGIRAQISTHTTLPANVRWRVKLCSADVHAKGCALPLANDAKRKALQALRNGTAPAEPTLGAQDNVPLSLEVARCITPFYPPGSTHAQIVQGARKGYIVRSLARRVLHEHPELQRMPVLSQWIYMVMNTRVQWDRVVEYEDTGISETGYDLSVPGHETFMTIDGTVLSNTFQVHVPVLKPADDVEATFRGPREEYADGGAPDGSPAGHVSGLKG